VIIDPFSRRLIGWAIANRMNSELDRDAFEMVLWGRRSESGLAFHSD
jgi:transposase InsO family protein